jgi:molybdopterin converting factor small subunit
MAARVEVLFSANILKHVAAGSVTVEAESVGEALQKAFAIFPAMRGYVLDDQGAVRRHVTIFLNNRTIRDRTTLKDPLADADEVYVYQALSGG